MVNDDRTVYKSAETGEFVSKEFAEANPDTTYATTIEAVDDIDESRQSEGQPRPSDGTRSKGAFE